MMLNYLLPAFLGIIMAHAQNQSGFISIDCGIPHDSSYTDKITGINYVSDSTFIDTGVINNISSEYSSNKTLERQFLNVRSFPEGIRNCYTLKPSSGDVKFLIRARFMYGNYDGQNIIPSFSLLLEADVWDSVNLKDASGIVTKEIIHAPKKNYMYVCLVNTGSGTPFISALELRPLKNSTYETQSGSLLLYGRWDVGSTTSEAIRYPDDVYDRIWSPYRSLRWESITRRSDSTFFENDWQLPLTIMRTAVRPANASINSLSFYWKTSTPESQYYIFLHFAEVEGRQENQTREMSIYSNGKLWYGPFVPYTFFTTTLVSIYPSKGSERIDFSINKTENSTLPPILNAEEIYLAKEFPSSLTSQQDVDAIMSIKKKYGVKKNWQGDPCAPKVYLWQGLNCSYDGNELPRIISLNLSSSGISGDIITYIFSLTSLQALDLSKNSLTGSVPEFLSELHFLRVLNLTGNNLEGSVPAGLLERAKNGLLSLSVDGNPKLCHTASCNKRQNKKYIVPVAASVVSLSVLLTALAILWNLKRRKQGGSWELKNRKFSYSDVAKITNNFEKVIGKGGFGTVYHGYLEFNGTQVAVKMLSASSVQGYKQFQAEVELLMRVHHKNLTTLVGYCDEDTNMGLIYEFMAKGNLEEHLSGANTLTWEARLRIATEAAQGLEYLHSGCKPHIVHRDVKSTNILINEKFQAKLADFGLSRIFPVEGGTHVSTTIAGTPGYLDPEYYISNRLTEKSDVYSFGVVLLEIITSKPVIERTHERTHITQWVSFMLAKGDIKNIVDPTLYGDFDINSVWKIVEIAMACVSPTSTKRPTMTQVVMELNESMAIEIARTQAGKDNDESKVLIELIDVNLHSEFTPLAR
ncbi:protein kinase domain-containing protein [Citrus sinensis]|nr:protein kinase domain-containing protein [Citrus sinensis]